MGSPPSLGQLITGQWTTQAVYVAAKLGLSDILHADGPLPAAELARRTDTNPDALFRLLRALASLGVYRQLDDGRFALTPLAEELREGVPGSQRAMALTIGEEHHAAWGELLYCIRTGKPGFDKVYGKPVFDWLGEHPEQAATFDAAMVSVHGRETTAMLDAYDFADFDRLADVGGGNGSLLRAVLTRHPKPRGMLCDLPSVLQRARPLVEADGLAERMELIPTNFFEEVPRGASVYVMRHIIHDWTDEKSLTILGNVRKAIPADGRLLLVECVIKPGNDPGFGKMLDLNMLVVPGGKERTEPEFRNLLQRSGFRLERIVPTSSDVSVIEARPI